MSRASLPVTPSQGFHGVKGWYVVFGVPVIPPH